MPTPKVIDINYSYKKPDTEVWVLNLDDIPVNKKLIKDQQIVHLAPNSIGGNHKHPRTEWFVGIGDLLFVWIDDEGVRHKVLMNPNGQLRLITIPPFLPHAVANKSQDKTGVLFEMADGKMENVEQVKVI